MCAHTKLSLAQQSNRSEGLLSCYNTIYKAHTRSKMGYVFFSMRRDSESGEKDDSYIGGWRKGGVPVYFPVELRRDGEY